MSIDGYAAIQKRLTNVTTSVAPEPPEPTPVDPTARLPQKTINDNLRRLKYPVLITEHADGTRTFKHDIVNRQSDGLISSVSTDRGAGERSSDALAKEQRAAREPSGPARDASGRFTSKDNGDAA
jgi:hypothetical protein